MKLKNKKILITAGPTWVPIDDVRVISNTATGKTGILLAERLQRLGAKVTLLLGPSNDCCLSDKIRLIHFRFFDELKDKIIQEVKYKKYDIVIHTCAVSDYKPIKNYKGKISSHKKGILLRLKPTLKIINLIKKINRSLFLVGFKFEPEATKQRLVKAAKALLKSTPCDLVIGNTLSKGNYRAYIVGERDISGPITDRKSLVERLIKQL